MKKLGIILAAGLIGAASLTSWPAPRSGYEASSLGANYKRSAS